MNVSTHCEYLSENHLQSLKNCLAQSLFYVLVKLVFLCAYFYVVSKEKMIGVQSCKHFGCQRSQPMILGFRHPSGALGDGTREEIYFSVS